MKTPDEIKRGLECCNADTIMSGCKNCPYERCMGTSLMIEDALAYIQQLEAKVPQWISVKERLPENDDYYLTYTTEYTCEVYRYDGDGEWVTAWDDTANHDITHWMPLPELPEE